MKLWSSTAIGSQRSRCVEIGSPERRKMPTYSEFMDIKNSVNLDFEKNLVREII